MGREIVYVDMDGVLVDFPNSIDHIQPSIRENCIAWVNQDPKNNDWTDFEGLFASLLPKDGIQEAIDRLEVILIMNKYQKQQSLDQYKH